MSILVDNPRWLWRGERWSHLVSDDNTDELHLFATNLGLRRLAFQGDHYDLPQTRLDAARAAGAILVDSRVLVRRLRDSGLRHRRPMGWTAWLEWQHDGEESLGVHLADRPGIPPTITTDIETLSIHVEPLAVVVLRREGEWGVGLTTSAPTDVTALPATRRRWAVSNDRGHHVDWFVPDHPVPPEADTGAGRDSP
ncbi:MAG: DUF4031 domain-containing protein [Acidimicrobiales bacterium]